MAVIKVHGVKSRGLRVTSANLHARIGRSDLMLSPGVKFATSKRLTQRLIGLMSFPSLQRRRVISLQKNRRSEAKSCPFRFAEFREFAMKMFPLGSETAKVKSPEAIRKLRGLIRVWRFRGKVSLAFSLAFVGGVIAFILPVRS